MSSINAQINSLENLLTTLKRESAELISLDEDEKHVKKKKVVLDEEQKRNRSSSAWAKSKVPIVSYSSKLGKTREPNDLGSLDVEKGYKATKTEHPKYSFPKDNVVRVNGSDVLNPDIPGPQKYNVKDDKVSTKRRPPTAFVTTEKRDVIRQEERTPAQTRMDDNDSASYEIIEEERILPHGYSFPKAKRFSDDRPETDEEGEVVVSAINIDSAEKAVLPHTPGPIMRPKTAAKIQKASEREEKEADSAELLPPKQIESAALDKLSTRYRSPGVRIFSEEKHTDKRNKVDIETEIADKLRGPGCYNVDDQAISFIKRGRGIATGTVIHGAAEHKRIPYAEIIKTAEKTLDEIRGPGYYDPKKEENAVLGKVPVLYHSESKPTKHLEKKRYFEEKAALARNDFLDADDRILRRRVPTVNLAVNGSTLERFSLKGKTTDANRYRSSSSDSRIRGNRRHSVDSYYDDYDNRKWSSRSRSRSYSRNRSSESDDSDHSRGAFQSWLRSSNNSPEKFLKLSSDKSRKNLPPRPSSARGAPASRLLSYEIKYDLVERKPIGGVSMKQEVQSREKTKEMLQNKPQTVEALNANKASSQPPADKYYGPQLPVPWVMDKAAMKIPDFYERMKKKRKKKGDEEDVDEDAAIAEVMRLLGDETLPQSEKEETDPFTNAYLKSSYSGSSIKKSNPVKLQDQGSDLSKRRKQEKDLLDIQEQQIRDEFLGPQLPLDWTKPDVLSRSSTRYKQNLSHSIQFDKQTSRGKKKVFAKGMVAEESFTKIEPNDDMGPGKYDVMKNKELGNGKGVIPFEKVISRKDQVGAFGERPISAIENDHLDKNEELEYYGELDIEYGKAKDLAQRRHQVKGVPLYTQDRYPIIAKRVGADGEEEEDPLDNHLGGSWFEGMADQVKKKSSTKHHIDFSKMKGRGEEENGEELMGKVMKKEMDIELNEELDLQVKDYHPHKPRTPALVGYNNPHTDPRFKEVTRLYPERELTEEEKKRREIMENPMKYSKVNNLVDMSKMAGRGEINGEKDDNELIQRMVHGDINDEEALRIQREQERAIGAAKDKRLKPLSRNIDFDKQISSKKYEKHESVEAERYLQQELGEDGKLVQEAEGRDIHENKTIAYTAKQRNLIDFNRMSKQQDHENERKIAKEEIFHEAELDLDPKKTEFLSNQKRVKGMVDFDKQERIAIPHERSVKIDPDIDNEEIRPREGEILDLKPEDPGNFKKGMHSMGNLPNQRRTMHNQHNPREENISGRRGGERERYQEQLQDEYGLVEKNPYPSQPGIILENNSKDVIKPRTQQVTSMKTTEPQVPISTEQKRRILENELGIDQARDGDRVKISTNVASAAEAAKSTKIIPGKGKETEGSSGGQKRVTSLKQKEARFDGNHDDSIHEELEREIGLPIGRGTKDQGNVVQINATKKDSQKNATVSSMRNNANNEVYYEKKVLKEIPEFQSEEVVLQTKDELDRIQQQSKNTPVVVAGGTKPIYQGATSGRIPSEHEKRIVQSLDSELKEEVIVDEDKIRRSTTRGGGIVGGGAVQSRASRDPISGAKKEKIIAQAMVNQISDKELRKSLSKNQDITSEEIILNRNPADAVRKSIPNSSTMKQSSERIPTVNDNRIKQELDRGDEEELILNPTQQDSTRKKTSFPSNKATRTSTTKGKPNSSNSTKVKSSGEEKSSKKGKIKDSTDSELLVISTPKVNAPTIADKPPQTKDSDRIKDLINKFDGFNV